MLVLFCHWVLAFLRLRLSVQSTYSNQTVYPLFQWRRVRSNWAIFPGSVNRLLKLRTYSRSSIVGKPIRLALIELLLRNQIAIDIEISPANAPTLPVKAHVRQ